MIAFGGRIFVERGESKVRGAGCGLRGGVVVDGWVFHCVRIVHICILTLALEIGSGVDCWVC